MTLKYLIQKEFLQIRRNAFLPKLIIMFPIVIMCVMPWVMQMEVKNIVVDVVDNDHSTRSQQIVHSIEASDYFISGGQKATYRDALAEIEHGKADVVLVIPQNYGKDLEMGKMPQVLIAANAVNGTKGSMGSAYLSQIVTHSVPYASILSQPSILLLYNQHQNYKLYMIPALLAIVMMLMTGFLPTLNIVGEKEAGTIEQINVTPVSKWAFILSKLIPYWLIALFVITVCLLLAWLVYGITPVGPLWLVYVLAMLLALFFSSFGLIISNYSDTMQQAVFVMWVHHAAFGTFHPHALHAPVGLSYHLRQPHALLHRGHPHRLHPWRHPAICLASDCSPLRNRCIYGLVGRAELQEKQLNYSLFGCRLWR